MVRTPRPSRSKSLIMAVAGLATRTHYFGLTGSRLHTSTRTSNIYVSFRHPQHHGLQAGRPVRQSRFPVSNHGPSVTVKTGLVVGLAAQSEKDKIRHKSLVLLDTYRGLACLPGQ